MTRRASFGVVLVALACAPSCQARDLGPTPARVFGEQVFGDPRFSDSAFNDVSCATCHSSTRGDDGARLLPGGTLFGVTSRPHYFGGYELRLIDAVNFCYVYFMRGAPLDADDPKGKALYEFLASLGSGAESPAAPLTIVRDIVDVPNGDSRAGAEVYAKACQNCHGEAPSGRGKLSANVPTLPEITRSYPQDFPGVPPRLVVMEKVRHGQFFGVGGNMPFFSREALSDAQLGALLAFLGL